jgi:hypothetical protein
MKWLDKLWRKGTKAELFVHVAPSLYTIEHIKRRNIMSFNLQFSPEFFFAEGEPYDRSDLALNWRGKPVSLYSAACYVQINMARMWDDMAQDLFDCSGSMLLPEMVVERAKETNACTDLSSPVQVWIDSDGKWTLRVMNIISLIKSGNFEGLAKAYLLKGDYLNAALCYNELGQYDKAVQVCESAKYDTAAWVIKINQIVHRYAKSTCKDHARQWFIQRGIRPNPTGAENSKTGLPGSYRPVGKTCPSCQFFNNGCYAQTGRTGIHEKNANRNMIQSLASAIIAMCMGQKLGTIARLHVTGDFYRDGKLHKNYIREVAKAADILCKIHGVSRVAYTYTHATPAQFEKYRLLLGSSGVEVLYSDEMVAGGAIVYPFAKLRKLRKQMPNLKFVKCRNQLDKSTCKACTLCFDAKKDGFTIVFNPHGSGKKDATESTTQWVESMLEG